MFNFRLLVLPHYVITLLAASVASANEVYPTTVYWGDTHVHTALSGDAYSGGSRLEPDAAYRFARGEAVQSSSGQAAQLSRPLDFVVIADHGNNIGAALARDRYENEKDFRETALGKMWLAAKKLLEQGQIDKESVAKGALLPAHRSWQISVRHAGFRKTIWHSVTDAADRYNEPGRFTAFIGYEWTPSQEEGSSEHRVVLFADDQQKANQVLPFTSYDSAQEEELWQFLDRYEYNTGGRAIAIPHNSNLTSGAMFALTDSYGFPLSERYARTRARFEPVVEVTQIKGDSETHPFLSPDDAFADYETWDSWRGRATPNAPVRKEQLPHEYVRSALKLGLGEQAKLGVNPFQFGLIGSTDAHTGLAAADDDNFWGKSKLAEPSTERIFNPQPAYNWQMNAAGYAAVWALANTREAIFDALLRKETYATTGPRMTVRLFGGFDFIPADKTAHDLASIGYNRGVPMGGSLVGAPEGKSPVFLVAASMDPLGANLDRIQIVKGWRTDEGEVKEKVYDVAWSGKRKPDGKGVLPAVGNTVDVSTATFTNNIGAPQLIEVWEDPDFDPTELAFYYARVLQIPTPRWTLYDIVRYDIRDAPANIPLTTQERAYTSAIWYTP
ncbi:MAG: DUF3604 domain-containing protein [Pseudomonadota bacterium]